ncbi:MAG: response regulator [Calditrichia bacterium]
MLIRKRVLFVDDEPFVLQGLKRMLWPMRQEFEFGFASNGPEALELLAQKSFDVVVTDMRMPGMDGLQLLSIISQKYPNMIRIILSGQANEELILRSVAPTHQFLSKPCDPEVLKSTIRRTLALRDFLANEKLTRIIAQIDTLPSLPDVYVQLVQELQSKDVSLKKIGQIISRDLGMTAKILKVVNSAYFGLRRQINDPVEAVNYLGLNTIRALVLFMQVFSQLDQKKLKELSLDELFEHSLKVASYAEKIVRAEKASSSMIAEAFVAGMLHDLGKIIIADKLPDEYTRVKELTQSNQTSDWMVEQELLGATHAEVGAYLLGIWGISDPIIEALAYHHQPGKCVHEQFSLLTAVHVANALANSEEKNLTKSEKIDMGYLETVEKSDRISVWKSEILGL